MTLDEAIKHAEEVAKQQMQRIDNLSDIPRFGSSGEDIKLIEKCEKCAEQHRQLAEWLRDYKRLKEQEPSGDLISRQKVIDMLNDIDAEVNDGCGYMYDHWMDYIKQLPSVSQPCGDAISRKDAEKRIDEALSRVFVDSEGIGKKILSKLPSITPERPKGHWIMKHRNINNIEYHTGEDVLTDEIYTVKELIRYETDDPYCSECGKRADDIAQDFCGYCGAYMRGDENE